MESKLHLGPECTQESHVVDGLPPTPATCLPEGETGSEEELEKGEKASSSSSLPSVRTSKQCKYCALSWKQGFGASGARCPWCHLCPGEAKTLKDVVAKRLNLAATLPPLALQFESEEARGSGSSFPEVLPLLTKSLPPVPPPTRSAPNFQEAQVPPAPCWDSEPKGLELETFEDEVKLDDVLRVKSAVNASLPSVGSILHGTGTCKPCAWFWKPQGCRNGAECGHCHLCPVGESKNRRQAKMAAWRQGGPPLSGAATSLPPLALVPPVPEEPLWRPPPGLDLSPTVGLPPLPPVPPPVAPPPPAPASPAALLTGPALGSVGSAKHSTGECTLCPDAFTPEGCPKGPLCEKCHLCAAEFRAVSDVSGPEKDSAACILCGTNRCSCPRIHSGMACTEPDVVAVENPTDLPSLGSVLHAKGNCSPCAWVWKAQGCHNGRSCGRCHLCPPGEVKLRKKAKAREARHGRKEYFCSSY